MSEKFTLATGHKKQSDRVEMPMPSTLHIMNEAEDFGWRIQIEHGALVITQVNHNDSSGMVILPKHANQVHVK